MTAYEDRGVTYRCEVTEADLDALVRGEVPTTLLSGLLSLRIAMQQTAAENLARQAEKRAHRRSTSPTLPRGVS